MKIQFIVFNFQNEHLQFASISIRMYLYPGFLEHVKWMWRLAQNPGHFTPLKDKGKEAPKFE